MSIFENAAMSQSEFKGKEPRPSDYDYIEQIINGGVRIINGKIIKSTPEIEAMKGWHVEDLKPEDPEYKALQDLLRVELAKIEDKGSERNYFFWNGKTLKELATQRWNEDTEKLEELPNERRNYETGESETRPDHFAIAPLKDHYGSEGELKSKYTFQDIVYVDRPIITIDLLRDVLKILDANTLNEIDSKVAEEKKKSESLDEKQLEERQSGHLDALNPAMRSEMYKKRGEEWITEKKELKTIKEKLLTDEQYEELIKDRIEMNKRKGDDRFRYHAAIANTLAHLKIDEFKEKFNGLSKEDKNNFAHVVFLCGNEQNKLWLLDFFIERNAEKAVAIKATQEAAAKAAQAEAKAEEERKLDRNLVEFYKQRVEERYSNSSHIVFHKLPATTAPKNQATPPTIAQVENKTTPPTIAQVENQTTPRQRQRKQST